MKRRSPVYQRLSRRAALVGLASLTVLGATACEPRVALRGNDPLASRLEQIQIGQSTKRDVLGLIGSPSSVGTFDDTTWYYMSQRKESWGFYDPEVIDHKVLAFHFDEAGVLQDIVEYDKDSLNEIAYRDKVTPTSGRTMSIFEQLFGNFGKVGNVQN